MMRSWTLLLAAAEARHELEHPAGCRKWARRLRKMAELEGEGAARAMLLSAADDYERIADSLDSISRSKEWINKLPHRA